MASGFQSLKGQLLLDGGRLHGSFFHRTVVLICEHDGDGAFGLVLNRCSEGKVGELLDAEVPPGLRDQPVFVGGPVQPTALSYLHTDTFLLEPNVLPDLTLGHSLESLFEIGGSFSATRQVRVFAGYAGWSPGQLDDEMKREAWLVHPASTELIFSPKPEEVWAAILRTKGWPYRLLAQAPDDVSRN